MGIFVINSDPIGSNWNVNVTNNIVESNAGAGFIGFNVETTATNMICLTLDNNQFKNPTLGPTAYLLNAGAAGKINVDLEEGNVGGFITTNGPGVNFIPQNSCSY